MTRPDRAKRNRVLALRAAGLPVLQIVNLTSIPLDAVRAILGGRSRIECKGGN